MKKTRGLFVAVAGAHVVVGVELGACSLNFDQFNPVDQGAPLDATAEPSLPEGQASTDTTLTNDAGADTGSDGNDGNDGGDSTGEASDALAQESGCPSSLQPCFENAQSCGANCARQLQICTATCQGANCRFTCRMQDQGCVTQCDNACTGCTQSTGCPTNATDCLDAARGGQ